MSPALFGVRRPKCTIRGRDFAGRVTAVGTNVTDFRPGDEVYGDLGARSGAFAEYAAVPQGQLDHKPANLTFEQAAAVPLAANTALLGLRDAAEVQPGQRVLINGASGGVGTFAVQLARAYGAEVTGVCGPRNVDLVRSLGAAGVIDYSTGDFTRDGSRYDVLVDIAGTRPVSACRRALAPEGTLVAVGGPAGRWLQPAGHVFAAVARAPFISHRVVVTAVGRAAKRHDLVTLMATLTGLLENGTLTPTIDRRYAFADLPAALAYQERGHAAGKVVVSV
jgi:NADPH:quinone reductase-like Zn-dependent oxidoreductase